MADPVSLFTIGTSLASGVAGAVGQHQAARKQQKAQDESRAEQRRMMDEQQKKISADNKKVSDKRRAMLAGRLGGGRQSLFFEGSELGVDETKSMRNTLG